MKHLYSSPQMRCCLLESEQMLMTVSSAQNLSSLSETSATVTDGELNNEAKEYRSTTVDWDTW